jgi:ABC-type dipeptide/oligopeptide/nickel transport system permease subunit
MFGTAIMASTVLGLIGLNAGPPNPEWGTMTVETITHLQIPVLAAQSMVVILTPILIVVAFNLLGFGLRPAAA